MASSVPPRLRRSTYKNYNTGSPASNTALVTREERAPYHAQCCPTTPTRRIPRSIYERARDVARSLAATEAFEQSRHDRKRIEMRFAHLKSMLRLGRLRLRGPRGDSKRFLECTRECRQRPALGAGTRC